MLQMLGHVKRRPEHHHIGALEAPPRAPHWSRGSAAPSTTLEHWTELGQRTDRRRCRCGRPLPLVVALESALGTALDGSTWAPYVCVGP